MLRFERSMGRRVLVHVATLICLMWPHAASAEDFVATLARVDQGLRTNPGRVSQQALQSCHSRRNFAVRLYDSGYRERGERGLKFCIRALNLSETGPVVGLEPKGPTIEELAAKSAKEVERALELEPDPGRGLQIYRDCALCHEPEGFGLQNGSVPQLAGQHRKVVIKQLADIRAGNRDAVLMVPYASADSIGGAQAVADVAAYVDTLEISVATGKGSGQDLVHGERLYAENCVRCHGENGEGNNDTFVPRIQSQHFNYLVRQFEWIREGRRRNANPEMVEQIQGFEERDIVAVSDYVSRLEPPAEFQAPPGWQNPDFAERPFESVKSP